MEGERNAADRRFVEFGAFRVDLAKGVLLRQGTPVAVTPKTFETLVRLIAEPGELVTKTELMESVWPDTIVEENNLTQCVSSLRRALGDGENGTRYIVTVPKRGYRFVAEVREVPFPEEAPARGAPVPARPADLPPRTMGRVAAPLAVLAFAGAAALLYRRQVRTGDDAAPVPLRSLAVLPLTPPTNGPDQRSLADGISELLIGNLAKIGSLDVISPASVLPFRGTHKPLAEIARELHVDAVVEGSAARSGDRVTLSARLVGASPERQLWERSYAGSWSEVSKLPAEMARDIAERLGAPMTPEERRRVLAAPVVPSDAYESYLMGRFQWNREENGDAARAVASFEKAVTREPRFAEALAALADCYFEQHD